MIGPQLPKIGTYKPQGALHHKTYKGKDPSLKGKCALVGFTFVGGQPVAQFCDVTTLLGYGWHKMKHSDFW